MERIFDDRREAGRLLGEAVRRRAFADPVVLALPRGGVPVAVEVARMLHAPLDLVLVRKIGAPDRPELAVAAVADGAEPFLEVDETSLRYAGASLDYVRAELPRHLAEIERRRKLYLGGRKPVAVEGRTAVLVDDGVATGTTVRAALRALRARRPRWLVLAVPVAPAGEIERLRAEVDDLICLSAPAFFGAVGAHYRHFEQTGDDEVTALLEEAANG